MDYSNSFGRSLQEQPGHFGANPEGLQLRIPAGFAEHFPPAKAAYRQYWLHGCASSDVTVAVDTAVSLGYDRDMVISGMQGRATKDRLVLTNEEAIRSRVFDLPFFLLDGEPSWGSDRLCLIVKTTRERAG